MSTHIDANLLKNFIVKATGLKHLTQNEAKKAGINADEFQEANADENSYLELDEIIDDTRLYEKFATLYVEEQEKTQEAKDKEKEKRELQRVNEKSDAKA